MNIALRQVNSFIDKNYDQISSVKEIAKACNVNYHSLRKRINKKTGLTLKEILTRKKIEQSKKALLETREKIFNVAETIGFKTTEGYIKAFKKFTGYTPKKYREKFKRA